MSTTSDAATHSIRSLIPARLDRLNWSPFHTRLVCGLGGAWILDGLQITVASSVSGELMDQTPLMLLVVLLRRVVVRIVRVSAMAMVGVSFCHWVLVSLPWRMGCSMRW